MTVENIKSQELEHGEEYLKRLGRVSSLSSRDSVPWMKLEGRIEHVGPWRVQRFREVNVEKKIEERELRRLIGHAKFSLWLELRDAGKQDEADKMIGRTEADKVIPQQD